MAVGQGLQALGAAQPDAEDGNTMQALEMVAQAMAQQTQMLGEILAQLKTPKVPVIGPNGVEGYQQGEQFVPVIRRNGQ